MRERLVMHVDMNAFFASVEQRYNPALRGKPIIVCGNPKSRTVVAACSYEAKAFGISNGMSVHDARRLCPHVIPVGGNPHKYVDIAQRIFALMGTFTPEVEIFSIDEAFLDVTATAASFGGPEATARRIKQGILEAHGLTCSVGIGPNKLMAKVASKLHKPDGLVRVRAEEVPALMARLPVERVCGIGPKLQVALNEMGLMTCAQLGDAPERLLVARFGVIGRMLKRMGQGIDHSPVMPLHMEGTVKSMGHAYTLPCDSAQRSEVLGTLLRLSEQVGRRLRADGYQGRTVGLTIRFKDFSAITHQATLACPTDHGLRIYETGIRLYQRYCEPLTQRVRLVGIGMSGLSRHERQLSFLDDELRLERLDRCLDQLADRFGEWVVVRAGALAPLVTKSHGFLIKHKSRRGLMVQ